MNCCETINKKQLFNLVSGMLAIYAIYFIAGILHQSLVKRPHYNRFTNNYEVCQNAAGLMLIPFATCWIIGYIYNKIQINQPVTIPHKNSALSGFAVVAATYFSTLAIQRTSFPVVIMFESCSILPVVFVGVFCSRVSDPNLKLGPQKIIVALIITAGILIFQFNDPESKQRQVQQQFLGILFLLFHFVAQGFLPDLQAEIKVNFKPQPTEMMVQINKWCTIITVILTICTWSLWSFIVYLWSHVQFTIDLFAMSLISTLGQFFIYRMIKQFKQHFVPFTISSRKILTTVISIVFYQHKTNAIQITGICVVFFTVFVQFLIQITKKEQKKTESKDVIELNQQKFQDNFQKPDQSNEKSEQFKNPLQKMDERIDVQQFEIQNKRQKEKQIEQKLGIEDIQQKSNNKNVENNFQKFQIENKAQDR